MTASLMVGQHLSNGFTGIAPHARLFSGGVIETGQTIARIILGLDWMLDRGISVLNMSLGVPQHNPIFRTLLRKYAENDILVVAPTGNQGAGNARSPGDFPEVLSVGSHDQNGRACKFSGSSYATDAKTCLKPELLAPGQDVAVPDKDVNLKTYHGTSLSCAYLAAIALLLRQAVPDASAASIKAALFETSLRLTEDQRHRCKFGMVDPIAALDRLHDDNSDASVHVEDRYFHKRWVDPRVTSLLGRVSDTHVFVVVLEFTDYRARDHFFSTLDLSKDRSGLLAVKEIKHAPVAIMRGPSYLIHHVMSYPDLRLISAGDFDTLT